MTPLELLTLVALTAYAIYKQTQKHEVIGKTRFKLAIIYAAVGLVVGGVYAPDTALSWAFLGVSIVLSVVVGAIRAKYTKLWKEGDAVYSQGTVFTVSLFIALVASKFVLGTIEYFMKIDADGGFGTVLILIAAMVAVQAELVWRRAQQLRVT
ncbi:MAG: hypothetical protein WBP12_00815 [Candidatus Saccharimonas sp.]